MSNATATAMLAKLTEAGLTEGKSREIVKAEIASGSITADGDFIEHDAIGKADVAAIEAAASAISKAMELGGKPASDAIAKAGDGDPAEKEDYDEADADEEDADEEDEDKDAEEGAEKSLNSSDYDVVAILSKGADQILDSVETQNKTLAKGYMAIRDTFSNFADVLNKASERIATLEGTVSSLHKSLGQPVPPRSVSGMVEAVPTPGEAAIAKAGLDESTFSTPEMLAKAKSLMASSKDDSNRLYQLSMAVAELESGAPPSDIAVRYGIIAH
jgi:hypothetical protein